MAAELAYLEVGGLIEEMVTDGKFTSEESRSAGADGITNYFAAAVVLPTGSSTMWQRISATTSNGFRRSTR